MALPVGHCLGAVLHCGGLEQRCGQKLAVMVTPTLHSIEPVPTTLGGPFNLILEWQHTGNEFSGAKDGNRCNSVSGFGEPTDCNEPLAARPRHLLLLGITRLWRPKPQSSSPISSSVPVGRRGSTSPSFHRMRRGYVDMIQANPRCRRRELSTAGVFAAERLLEFAPPEV